MKKGSVMKYMSSDKYNLAWFRLAECVNARRKREGFRCISSAAHSIQDAAYALQLEGDLLLSFNVHQSAIVKYVAAIALYKQQERFHEVIALYEHLEQYSPEIYNMDF